MVEYATFLRRSEAALSLCGRPERGKKKKKKKGGGHAASAGRGPAATRSETRTHLQAMSASAAPADASVESLAGAVSNVTLAPAAATADEPRAFPPPRCTHGACATSARFGASARLRYLTFAPALARRLSR